MPLKTIIILLIMVGIAMVYGLITGQVDIHLLTPSTASLIFELRITRLCAAMIVGLCLGAAGAALQGALANPLADPYILGVSSGAGLGAATAVALCPSSSLPIALPTLAILGALITMLLVVIGVKLIGRHSPTHFLLVGIAVNACFSALTLLMLVTAGPRMNWVLLWLMGDFSQASPVQVILSALITFVGIGLLMRMGPALDAMSLGDEVGTSFGFNITYYRQWTIIIASILTAAAVSMGGIIGFLALVVPHIVRLLGIRQYRWLVLVSAIWGSLILITCDGLARAINPTAELPIGVVTALLGTPFFFFLLWKRRHVQ
jgi:iron complex transport system permease protein